MVEALGAELGAGVDEDAASVGVSAPRSRRCRSSSASSPRWPSRPAFPTGEVERLRRGELAGLLHDLDEPGVVADRAVIGAAYGDHPYGHPSEGRRRHLAATRRRDLAEFHARHWRPSRATLVLVGPVDPARHPGPGAPPLRRLARRAGGRPRGRPAGAARPRRAAGRRAGGLPGPAPHRRARASHAPARTTPPGWWPGPRWAAASPRGSWRPSGWSGGSPTACGPASPRGRAGGLFLVSSFTKVETAGELVQVALDELAALRRGRPHRGGAGADPRLPARPPPALAGDPRGLVRQARRGGALRPAGRRGDRLPRPHRGGGRRGLPPGGGAARSPAIAGWWWRSARPARSARQLERFGPVQVVPARSVM